MFYDACLYIFFVCSAVLERALSSVKPATLFKHLDTKASLDIYIFLVYFYISIANVKAVLHNKWEHA